MFSNFFADVKTLANELASTASDAASELSIAASQAATELKHVANDFTHKIEDKYDEYIVKKNDRDTLWFIWQAEQLHNVNILRTQILNLAHNNNSFNAVSDCSIEIDYEKYKPFVQSALQNDKKLAEQYTAYVPNKLTEQQFWTNYMQHVEMLRQSLQIDSIVNRPNIPVAVAEPIATQPVTIPVATPLQSDAAVATQQDKKPTALPISDPFQPNTTTVIGDKPTEPVQPVNSNPTTTATVVPVAVTPATVEKPIEAPVETTSSAPSTHDSDLDDLERQLSELDDNDASIEDLGDIDIDDLK